MAESFDVAVVGSGFGGSVITYRVATAGKSVCLLERGKAYPPGSFSRTPRELGRNFWDPSRASYGLFNVWAFRHIDAVISSGLGGGSLIYANVFVRKDEAWFARGNSAGDPSEVWPPDISRATLDPHYDAVENAMRPARFPKTYWDRTKTAAMRDAATTLGFHVGAQGAASTADQWYDPLLNVTFADEAGATEPGRVFDPGRNYHKAPRETCRLCGECDVGCNYGAKNTLDFNYITFAQNAGAEIRPCTEVKSIRRKASGEGFVVSCVRHDGATEPGAPPAPYTIEARRVILAAGTLGTTYLLLKLRERGDLSPTSRALGTRFSGNGDLLLFVRDCRDGSGKNRTLNASRAPVITSTFRFPDDLDAPGNGRGFYLQDAGYPLVVDYMWEGFNFGNVLRRTLGFALERLAARLGISRTTDVDRQLARLVGNGAFSSTSMPLLAMGRDVADGQMFLEGARDTKEPALQVSWKSARSAQYIDRVVRETKRVAAALGGRFSENPLTTNFNKIVTVHPLGGCPMADSSERGVVDSYGRVYGYERALYVADGSMMPGAVGANPSFTIAAMADRVADAVIGDPL